MVVTMPRAPSILPTSIYLSDELKSAVRRSLAAREADAPGAHLSFSQEIRALLTEAMEARGIEVEVPVATAA